MIASVLRDGPRTVVLVGAEAGTMTADLGVIGIGEARCRPGDLDVPATGVRIALGRAIQDFGLQVELAGLEESVAEEEVERALTAIELLTGVAIQVLT